MALLFLTSCAADKRNILPPLPPVTHTVYVYRPLPDELRRPCARVDYDPAEIVTDIDLMGLLKREQGRGDCNEQKLKDIDKLYRSAPE